ncbi:von Willebrand factor A domain-containing protein 5A [Gonapodya sp. JEL0774]|nr:von Willebrand factor A domain-containing protein 5A [Gonapodya sp. JEL0774]
MSGLFLSETEQHLIPLQNVAADVSIIDCIASVTLSQTYLNEANKPVEAIYKFPIYESAAVYSFEAVVDGSVIRGVCKEREQAAKEYNAAIAAGDRAFLLEEQKADIFQISVGNIPPGKPVAIRISYIHECKTDETNDELRFTIPTTIAPKTYGTFTPPSGTNLLPGGTTYSGSADYTLSVVIDARMAAGPVLELSSPTHQIKVSLDAANPKHARATLALDTVYLDKDFVLVLKSTGLDKPRAVLEEDTRTGTKSCMVTFVPKFTLKSAPTEIIFVLDRSGSMEGENISFARTALLLFLKSLPQSCKFNIIGFGSGYELLFPNSVDYNEESLTKAVQHVEKVDADLGGTEILPPLQAAVREPLNNGWQRSIIALTDGEVYQPDSVFAFAAQISSSQPTRFFTLGVGSSVSHLLVNGLARAGLGSAEFVGAGERMEAKVVKLIKAGTKGFVRDYKVTWLPPSVLAAAQLHSSTVPTSEIQPRTTSTSFFDNDIPSDAPPAPDPETPAHAVPLVQPAPFRAPPLYAGTRYIAFAILDAKLPNPTSVTVSGVGPDGPIVLEVPISALVRVGAGGDGDSTALPTIHTMAAKKLVQDMVEGTSWIHLGAMGDRVEVDEARVRAEAVRIGTTYGLASKYTSYVAVQLLQGAEKLVGTPERIIVPSRAPEAPSYGGYAMPTVMTTSVAFDSITLPMMPMMAQAAPVYTRAIRRVAHSQLVMESEEDEEDEVLPTTYSTTEQVTSWDGMPPEIEMSSSNFEDDEDEDDDMGFGLFDGGPVILAKPVADAVPVDSNSSPEQKLLLLVSLQKFDGSFPFDSKLFALDPKVSTGPPSGRTQEEWATAFALAIMLTVLKALKDEWELVADKAQEWLDARIGEVGRKVLVEAAKIQFEA